MIRENQQLLNQFNVLTDAVAVFLAMLVSYWLRFDLFRGEYAARRNHSARKFFRAPIEQKAHTLHARNVFLFDAHVFLSPIDF